MDLYLVAQVFQFKYAKPENTSFFKSYKQSYIDVGFSWLVQTEAAKPVLGEYYREPKKSGPLPFHLIGDLIRSLRKDHFVSDTGDVVYYQTDSKHKSSSSASKQSFQFERTYFLILNLSQSHDLVHEYWKYAFWSVPIDNISGITKKCIFNIYRLNRSFETNSGFKKYVLSFNFEDIETVRYINLGHCLIDSLRF